MKIRMSLFIFCDLFGFYHVHIKLDILLKKFDATGVKVSVFHIEISFLNIRLDILDQTLLVG